MTSRKTNKRSRKSIPSEASIAEELLEPAPAITPLPMVGTAAASAPAPTPKRSRLQPASQDGTENILLVQHVVCVPCDNLFTLEAGMEPHKACVSDRRFASVGMCTSLTVSLDIWLLQIDCGKNVKHRFCNPAMGCSCVTSLSREMQELYSKAMKF
jgi:hypothetical protein